MAIRITSMPPVPRPDVALSSENKVSAAGAASDFGRLLAEALNNVEAAQQEAASAAQRLATGEIRDVAEVLIASEKATLALQMTVQVRNKVLEAYQEIMRMPV